MAEPAVYRYAIDAEDRIRFVSPEWLQFALDNEAPELNEAAVLGRPLWDFVIGEDTRRLYALLFAELRARSGERSLPFNCDSPTRVRRMRLTLRSQPAGAIALEGLLLASETRAPEPLFQRDAPRAAGSIAICSVCRRLEAAGEWVEVAEAVGRLRLFARALPPRLAETLCPDCGARGTLAR